MSRDYVTDEEAKVMSDYMFTMDEALTEVGKEILDYTHNYYVDANKETPEFGYLQIIASIMFKYSKKKIKFDKYFENMKKKYEKEVES